jgi:hypothetical protein
MIAAGKDGSEIGRVVRPVALLAALLSSLLLAGPLMAETRVLLELQPHATVSGDPVRLGEVARIDSGQADFDAVLQQSTLTVAPRVGQITHLTRAQIEHALRTLRLSHALQLEWRGAPAVQVHLAQQNVDPERLHQVARQALEQALQARGEQAHDQQQRAQARVRLAQALPEVALPLGQITITPQPLAPERLSADMPVWLELAVDGKFYRRIELRFAIDGEFVAQPITSDRVQKGAQVTLLTRQGAVQVQTMARVQQEGTLGQWVRVKPLQAAESVLARVRSGTLVEIE